jgi:hypothetical protein
MKSTQFTRINPQRIQEQTNSSKIRIALLYIYLEKKKPRVIPGVSYM